MLSDEKYKRLEALRDCEHAAPLLRDAIAAALAEIDAQRTVIEAVRQFLADQNKFAEPQAGVHEFYRGMQNASRCALDMLDAARTALAGRGEAGE